MTIRNCFTSWYPGGYLVEMDLEQIEIVCLAYLSGDPEMKRMVQEGVDFHTLTLAKISEMESGTYSMESYYAVYREWLSKNDSDTKKKRREVKSVRFQRSYGASAKSIAESTGLPISKVKLIVDAEELMFPGVKEWQDRICKTVQESREYCGKHTPGGIPIGTGYLESITGRKYSFMEREIPWRPGEVNFPRTEIINYPVQGLAGEILRAIQAELLRILIPHREWISWNNTVHDSLLWNVRDEESMEILVRAIQEVMDNIRMVIQGRLGIEMDLPIRYSLEWGDNWGSMKALDKPTKV